MTSHLSQGEGSQGERSQGERSQDGGLQGEGSGGVEGLAGQALGLHVRRHDPDRFLFSLFLPAAMREPAWILIAFNHELARAIESGSRRGDTETGRFASLVRLQWWREVVLGARRRHEVAGPLGALLAAGRIDAAALETMIAAREAELDGLPDLAAWQENLRAGPGTLARLMGALAGTGPDAPGDASSDALVEAGAAYGAGASLRNRAALAALGRSPFPADTPDPATLARAAAQRLAPPRRIRGPSLAPALHAVLARRDLACVEAGREAPGARGAADRLAVLSAWLRGRA